MASKKFKEAENAESKLAAKLAVADAAQALKAEKKAVSTAQALIDKSDWIKVQTAAQDYGYSYWTLVSAIESGRLPALLIDGRRFVRRSAVAAGLGIPEARVKAAKAKKRKAKAKPSKASKPGKPRTRKPAANGKGPAPAGAIRTEAPEVAEAV